MKRRILALEAALSEAAALLMSLGLHPVAEFKAARRALLRRRALEFAGLIIHTPAARKGGAL